MTFLGLNLSALYWPKIPEEMSQMMYDFISKLLIPDPSERLGARGMIAPAAEKVVTTQRCG